MKKKDKNKIMLGTTAVILGSGVYGFYKGFSNLDVTPLIGTCVLAGIGGALVGKVTSKKGLEANMAAFSGFVGVGGWTGIAQGIVYATGQMARNWYY